MSELDGSATAHAGADTPLMRQYLEIKRRHPIGILFFRLGDFYEMFFKDAQIAAEILSLTLTTRDKNKDDPIPMCGVPHHAAKGYIAKLVAAGIRVVICEQIEDPKLSRGVVRRGVTQIVTPGVILDEDQLDGKTNNYLAAIVSEQSRIGIAAIDLSTLEARLTQVEGRRAAIDELIRIGAREIIADRRLSSRLAPYFGTSGPIWFDALSEWRMEEDKARAWLEARSTTELNGVIRDEEGLLAVAAAMALHYIDFILPERKVGSVRFVSHRDNEFLVLDEATLANLEIVRSASDQRREGSLLATLDLTQTSMGARLLRQILVRPLVDLQEINLRLDRVDHFYTHRELRRSVRQALQGTGDLERLASRLALGLSTPRDLLRLGESLARIPQIDNILRTVPGHISGRLGVYRDALAGVSQRIATEIQANAPLNTREGGVFRTGIYAQLDEVVELATGGQEAILAMQARLRQETGTSSLKIRYNRVLGYFIEVTNANRGSVPEHFVRKQTLVNTERFTTPELSELELSLLGAQEQQYRLEARLFEDLRRSVSEYADAMIGAATALAWIDVYSALAEVAELRGYTRPQVDDSQVIEIQTGRHPVVETFVESGAFVPNDTMLSVEQRRLILLTGPNMAGKSTLIRQVALITLMAHSGSFVPCERARIGRVDRIFTRIGSGDNLARGQSTFMVEMSETATILDRATSRSLVILDEVGRGTSTYDGVSIAWAVAEHLDAVIGARTLFASHYHELSRIAEERATVHNESMAVREVKGKIVFLHRAVAGPASRSYGIEVARLAGVVPDVLTRASQILEILEDTVPGAGNQADQPSNLNAPTDLSAMLSELAQIETDRLTPLEALNLLAKLIEKLNH